MVIERGGIYWAHLDLPNGRRPAKLRQVLVVQADSVVNVTAVVTLNTSDLDEKCGQISDGILDGVNDGLRLVFDL